MTNVEKRVEKRRQLRTRRRLDCEIAMDCDRSDGIVYDLSARGLFVQTPARPRLNSVVEVIFPASQTRAEIRVEAGVARKHVAPRGMQFSLPTGVGLEILAPRTEYESCVFQPACPPLGESDGVTGSGDPGPKQATRSYRILLVRGDHSDSRVLSLRCESEANARTRALSRAGAGWKIADVLPL